MSRVRTIYRCDMCNRQYGATPSDPEPQQLSIMIGGFCVRQLKDAHGGRGEACSPCQERLTELVGAAFDALLVKDGAS